MGAVAEGYTPEEIGIVAIQAGTDILLSCHDPEIQKRIFRSVVKTVRDGQISQAEIDASVRRILYCKIKNLINADQRKVLFEQATAKK